MQATQGPESSGKGEKFGPYDTLARLEDSELGVAFLARDRRSGSRVVLKTLHLGGQFDNRATEELRRRFRREAEACAALHHEAILQVLDNGEDNDRCWIAYEHFDAEPLTRHVLDYDLLPVPEGLGLGATVAEALDHAHGRSVVHRDLRPANLLYSSQRRAIKIRDFGFAKVAETELSRTGLVLGTPSYKSPEQLAVGKITSASDVFSLGVTLYQLLTGRLPFEAESMVGLMHSIVQLPHVAASTARPALPAELDAVLDRALAKYPLDRYARASHFAGALRQCAGERAA